MPPPRLALPSIVPDTWTPTDTSRMGVLVISVIVGLGSGSNYVYSAYAPQLASQLVISSTQVNLVGVAGNLGMYLTGPLWGKVVDSRGQQIPLLLGSLLTFSGYTLVRAFYTLLIPIRPDPTSPPSNPRLFLLALCMFMTGAGGAAGLSASVNAAARSFPDKTRASATGTVLAGFGLSAFAFSTIGHIIFKGDAGGLLLVLAIGTGLPMFVGSFLVRSVPPTRDAEGYEPVRVIPDIAVDVYDDEAYPRSSIDTYPGSRSNSLELTRSRSPVPRGRPPHPHPLLHPSSPLRVDKTARGSSVNSLGPLGISSSPLQLLTSSDAHILFVILAILCGTGLMYINNVGTVALALAREGSMTYDGRAVSAWQAKQVATVSVWNAAGRIFGGVFSDFCKARLHMTRIWFLPVVALMFVSTQLAGIATSRVDHLWIVSTMLGLSYGSLFNVVPMLVLEWFGMTHFSQNYGWICVAPVIGGNVFNLLFGRVYDSNTVGRIGASAGLVDTSELVRALLKRAAGLPLEGGHDCLLGARCYTAAFKISTLGCLVAFVLSIGAGVKREQMSRERRLLVWLERAEQSGETI